MDQLNLTATKASPQKDHTDFSNVVIAKNMIDMNFLQPRGGSFVFPLFVNDGNAIISNLQPHYMKLLMNKTGIKYIDDENRYSDRDDEFTPKDFLAYLTAIMFSDTYRKTFKNQLRMNYPKVPVKVDGTTFKTAVKFGKLIISILTDDFPMSELSTMFPAPGKTFVDGISKWQDQQVWINSEQAFTNVGKEDWDYYLGGYQPLKQFLKMRKGRNLSNDEINNFRQAAEVIKRLRRVQTKLDKNDAINNFLSRGV